MTDINAAAWQESWDRQQEAYMPDREHRFTAMLDAVGAITDGPPAILDLAGGTGSISLRAQDRFRHAHTTLLDIDPVLMTIARASLDPARSAIVAANLQAPQWMDALPRRDYDGVLTATAMHWIAPDRLAEIYAEIRTVLRPGGVFINADHIPDDGLSQLTQRLDSSAETRRDSRWAAGVMLSWSGWWEQVAKDPVLGPLVPERAKVFQGRHSTESFPPLSWHVDVLRSAGFTESGLIWRGGSDAAVIGVR